MTCCAGLGCRVAASRVSWAKGAFGSQANTMLTVMVANLLNGTATSALRPRDGNYNSPARETVPVGFGLKQPINFNVSASWRM